MELTHFDDQGNAWMVDVGGKEDTWREAVAVGSISMTRECLGRVKAGSLAKGDVLGVARVAGIMGAKRTSELIPLCHPLNLTKLSLDFSLREEAGEIQVMCRAQTRGKTGVEMEALTGATVALLTIYDMCKAADKAMEIGQVYLAEKRGGKSKTFRNEKHKAGEGNLFHRGSLRKKEEP